MIAEDQVGIGQRCVLFVVPGLADSEVAKQIAGDVGFERNLHEGIEKISLAFSKCESVRDT